MWVLSVVLGRSFVRNCPSEWGSSLANLLLKQRLRSPIDVRDLSFRLWLGRTHRATALPGHAKPFGVDFPASLWASVMRGDSRSFVCYVCAETRLNNSLLQADVSLLLQLAPRFPVASFHGAVWMQREIREGRGRRRERRGASMQLGRGRGWTFASFILVKPSCERASTAR